MPPISFLNTQLLIYFIFSNFYAFIYKHKLNPASTLFQIYKFYCDCGTPNPIQSNPHSLDQKSF